MKLFHRFDFACKVLLRVAFIPVVCFEIAKGQTDGTFDSGSDGSDGALFIEGNLAPVENFSAAYDSARDEVLMFGGDQYFSPRIEFDHTYTFDGTSWNRERPEVSPSAREGAVIAYDSIREKVVIYSGDSNQNDCWLWDGTHWKEVDPPDPETSFYRFDIAFDAPRGETIMVVKREFSSEELETWAFDGTTWTQKFPATTIPEQIEIDLTYDENLQLVVMLLRVSSSEFQTWTWNGTDWTQVITDPVDIDVGFGGELVYDGRTNSTIFLGNGGNFRFTGSNWVPLDNVPPEFAYGIERVVYHPGLDALLKLNGAIRLDTGGTRSVNETWAWYADGSVELLTSGSYMFDMNEKADGIWNFTTIDIGPNVVVEFINNAANTALRWLTTGDVNIEGTLNVSGKEKEVPDLFPNAFGLGGIPGPGGSEGAVAEPLGTGLNVIGGGPGGGLYTGQDGTQHGDISVYSNPWIYPLTGGSGAGNLGGGSGGGGGGALLIASSNTITVDGQILSEGSTQGSGFSFTPAGSGGTVLLRAQTIEGSGMIIAGRIRLEAWERNLDQMTFEDDSQSFGNQLTTEGPPLLPVELGDNPPRLWIESINGVPAAKPRLSAESQLEVDAFISGSGMVPIVIKGENIPDSAEVYLKISLEDGSTLEPEAAIYTGGQATVNVDLPSGFGAIHATAQFPWNN